mmetsp:Transcript_8277/g.23801  ORF Transcript_8277/g.23801 Transcript_8277/m.23801 type:complete len:209 (-) Transcript_8277:722-1348(-)
MSVLIVMPTTTTATIARPSRWMPTAMLRLFPSARWRPTLMSSRPTTRPCPSRLPRNGESSATTAATMRMKTRTTPTSPKTPSDRGRASHPSSLQSSQPSNPSLHPPRARCIWKAMRGRTATTPRQSTIPCVGVAHLPALVRARSAIAMTTTTSTPMTRTRATTKSSRRRKMTTSSSTTKSSPSTSSMSRKKTCGCRPASLTRRCSTRS